MTEAITIIFTLMTLVGIYTNDNDKLTLSYITFTYSPLCIILTMPSALFFGFLPIFGTTLVSLCVVDLILVVGGVLGFVRKVRRPYLLIKRKEWVELYSVMLVMLNVLYLLKCEMDTQGID